MDKINKEDTDTKKDSNNNYKHQNDHIDRQGLNGYQKTDLDLEIERELQEMMENGESNKETKSKHFKILSFVSMNDCHCSDSHHTIHPKNDINIQMSLGQKGPR